MNKFQPIGNRVIIKKITQDSIGSVILPDISQEGTNLGEVIAIGPGQLLQNGDRALMQCNIGDKVYYPKFGAKEIEIESEEYYIISEHELLTIVK